MGSVYADTTLRETIVRGVRHCTMTSHGNQEMEKRGHQMNAESADVIIMQTAAILTRASGWHQENRVEVSVTIASTTQRATGVRGASLVITEIEENPCLPQRFANLTTKASRIV
uniref:Uncharacterized protein n=1 Tax=Sphaerodactylus townsendi TaxID=933632 RepID=A0ACB8EHP7_9SAUR